MDGRGDDNGRNSLRVSITSGNGGPGTFFCFVFYSSLTLFYNSVKSTVLSDIFLISFDHISYKVKQCFQFFKAFFFKFNDEFSFFR